MAIAIVIAFAHTGATILKAAGSSERIMLQIKRARLMWN
jgi:hypothetical protein